MIVINTVKSMYLVKRYEQLGKDIKDLMKVRNDIKKQLQTKLDMMSDEDYQDFCKLSGYEGLDRNG